MKENNYEMDDSNLRVNDGEEEPRGNFEGWTTNVTQPYYIGA